MALVGMSQSRNNFLRRDYCFFSIADEVEVVHLHDVLVYTYRHVIRKPIYIFFLFVSGCILEFELNLNIF